MDAREETRDLLLREYAEAGQISRQHEQLTRTSSSVFVPTLIALAGFVLTSGAIAPVRIVLALAGLAASLLAANVVRRHQLYYRAYIRRARAIEALIQVNDQQVVRLYSDAEFVKNGTCTVSSKTAFLSFFLLNAGLFGVTAIVIALDQVRGVAP